MTPDLIHAVWKFLQATDQSELLTSQPEKLVIHIIDALKHQGRIAPETEPKIRAYILSRLPLIDDLLSQPRTRAHCEA